MTDIIMEDVIEVINKTLVNKTNQQNDTFAIKNEEERVGDPGLLFILWLFGFALLAYVLATAGYFIGQGLIWLVVRLCEMCGEKYPCFQRETDSEKGKSHSSFEDQPFNDFTRQQIRR